MSNQQPTPSERTLTQAISKYLATQGRKGGSASKGQGGWFTSESGKAAVQKRWAAEEKMREKQK